MNSHERFDSNYSRGIIRLPLFMVAPESFSIYTNLNYLSTKKALLVEGNAETPPSSWADDAERLGTGLEIPGSWFNSSRPLQFLMSNFIEISYSPSKQVGRRIRNVSVRSIESHRDTLRQTVY